MKSKLKAENKVVKSGDVQIIKAKVFEDYNYIIDTDTSTMLVNKQELEDLEKCLWKLRGYEITHQNKMFIKKLPPIKDVQKVVKGIKPKKRGG
jgi:hypothetical protein